MQFEADHKKERKKEQLESQVREIEQHNAEIMGNMNEFSEMLRINRLKLWDLRLKLWELEE